MKIKEIKKHEYIWGFMYGHPTMNTSEGEKPDKLVKIEVSKLDFDEQGQCFYFVWGWPGPDYNRYKIEDYGVTWCFEPEEMPKAEIWR